MDTIQLERVAITGSTGFVGRSVVRELLARGITPVCLVRTPAKLFRQHPDVSADRLAPILGTLHDRGALREVMNGCQAAIHLVGIILERRLQGQTFRGVHEKGTQNAVDAAAEGGVRRFVHMSALGARADAAAAYQRTKWNAEQYVRSSGLDWTIFRPSIIHGPDGEFMQLMRCFTSSLVPPVIPYFGSGRNRLQPVFVKDVAHCFVEALFRPETIGRTFPLCGPRPYSWRELYNACRTHIPGSKSWKPLVSQPVAIAKAIAVLSAPPLALAELFIPRLGLFRFDRGQVAMSQEDSVADHLEAEKAFGIRMRDFEAELASYADQIR